MLPPKSRTIHAEPTSHAPLTCVRNISYSEGRRFDSLGDDPEEEQVKGLVVANAGETAVVLVRPWWTLSAGFLDSTREPALGQVGGNGSVKNKK
jgi:hypothetical protein